MFINLIDSINEAGISKAQIVLDSIGPVVVHGVVHDIIKS
jgi:hypothetical protein